MTVDVWQGSEFASGSEFIRILNIPLLCIYRRALHMPLVLHMPGFWIYQGSQYAWVTQGSEYAWMFSRDAFYIIWLIMY